MTETIIQKMEREYDDLFNLFHEQWFIMNELALKKYRIQRRINRFTKEPALSTLLEERIFNWELLNDLISKINYERNIIHSYCQDKIPYPTDLKYLSYPNKNQVNAKYWLADYLSRFDQK